MCYYSIIQKNREDDVAASDDVITASFFDWGVVNMNAVDPIKDKGTIQDIVEYLRGQSERNAMLFLFGIYSGHDG